MKEKQQPIAIVGMACRFPGGCNSPQQYWDLLCNGSDTITEIRPDRWSKDFYFHPDPKSSGKTYTAAAGQLDDIYHFDPEFFGISPREAAQMDPQQRLLLQMSWEALEEGGVLPREIAGSDNSVYIGVSSLDYANNRMDDPNVADAYFMTGNTLSIAANRISYIFDLHGPSMTIDTACSSSLVALHQACSSIWSGESSASIVGAVHLVLSPFPFIGFSKASMLSRRGRCSVFDAGADGYVRSEGGVVLYLKLLDKALQDNNRIHAVIRGTAVNSDGNTSAMTVPNGAAQAALLEKLYTSSRIDINHIDYIEAHGTGTPVGDPIETAALGQAIGTRRPATSPLLIGSVKTNIGHLEPASGFAGLLKVVLSLEHRAIPATIHQNRLNPQIDFSGLNLRVVNNYTGLTVRDRPLIMGVNSFGFGGTNAHTILAEYQRPLNKDNAVSTQAFVMPPLFISAMSEESLRNRAVQFHALVTTQLSPTQVYDLFYTAALKRQRLKYGLVAYGDTVEKISQALADFSEGKKSSNILRTEPLVNEGGVAFIFSGNGSQWPGMGRSLLAQDLFRNTIERIDAKFRPLAGWSLLDELSHAPDDSRLELTEVAQPLLFAVQVGIVELLKSLGIYADAVAGHSVGEIAGAYVAGALTLDDAIRVVYYRSIAQGRTKGLGKMAVVRLSPALIQPILDNYPHQLEIAAINASDSVTISGGKEAIRSIIEVLQEQAVSCRELNLDYAFHSKVMDEIEQFISANLGRISPLSGQMTFVSTVTGQILDSNNLDGQYWWNNIRKPVQFVSAIAELVDSGMRTFVEIGPHPVLQSYLRNTLQEKSVSGRILRTLKRNDSDEFVSVQAAAFKILFSRENSSLDNIFPISGQMVSLPAYPWNNSRYIFTGSSEAINKQREHPLLGFRLDSIDGVWLNQIDVMTHPYLADHVVDGLVIFPAAAYAEMALAASRSWFGRDAGGISTLEIRKPLILEPGKTRITQFQLSTRDLHFSIKSRDRLSDNSWTEHASGRLVNAITGLRNNKLDVTRLNSPTGTTIAPDEIYATAALYGLEYGRKFQGAATVVLDDNICLTELSLPDDPGCRSQDYLWHPVLMDSAFHALFIKLRELRGDTVINHAYIPVEMNDIRFSGTNAVDIAYSESVLHSVSNNLIRASFVFYNQAGLAVAEIKECIFRKLPRQEKIKKFPSYYQYRLVPKNLINPYIPSPLPGTDAILENFAKLPFRDELLANEKRENEQVLPLFDALASALAEQTLRDFGAHIGHFTLESLISASRIDPEYRTYISYLLNILEQDGKAVCHDGQWKLLDSQEVDDPVAIWRLILADYPAYMDVLRCTANNSFRIKDILTGHDESSWKNDGIVRPINTVAGQTSLQQSLFKYVVDIILRDWPRSGRRLRIAEIMDCPPVVANEIVLSLPVDFCDYEILALHDSCITQAEDLYRDRVNVTVTRFDPSKTGSPLKYREGEFDIVLAVNEMHSCLSLSEMFSQISCLLASAGMFLLLEKRPDRITDMNMGLTNPGWWHRSIDGGRPVSSNIPPEDWIYLLENSGFEDVRNLSESVVKPGNRYLICARRPARQLKDPVNEAEKSSALLIASGDGFSLELAQTIKKDLARDGVQTMLATSPGKNAGISGAETLDLLEQAADQLHKIMDRHSTLPLKILYMASLNDKLGELSSADTGEQITNSSMRLLNLIRALASMELKSKPTIWVITTGGISGINIETAISPNPFQSCLWGLGKVIRNEYPDIDYRMIDLQTGASIKNISRLLLQEISSSDGEEKVVIMDNARMVLRLNEFNPDVVTDSEQIESKLVDWSGSCHLAYSRAGSIENLEWHRHKRRLPSADEIEIEVHATGLNFRDIMLTSGLLPAEMLEGGHSGAFLGLECSGTVTRTGSAAVNFNVGDEVIAMASACFANHVMASRYAVIKKPDGMSFEAAATIPTAFFTIFYALNHMARLKSGERILIHGAAGGVGLAAIQYARYCNAEIFATAGTPEKRKFLELLGVEHVLNSRTLDFADQIMSITAGEGVDVVLNSLAGEAMARNFSVLRPFGRYIELGKRDFFENTKVDLKPFRNNITYYGVDADQLLSHEPELSHKLMREVLQLFNEGVFRPLPYTEFAVDDVENAFRYMQQSRHIGKVVVTRKSERRIIKDYRNTNKLVLNPDASYLIIGGLGGFGLATARWLVQKGARHLVLASRSGIQNDNARQVIDALIEQNIDVKIVQCDVTDAIRLQMVLKDIQNSAFPLKGIIHAAMVLADTAIKNIDYDIMHKVIAPKAQGSWNLHRLTLNYQLDMFVLYSSATTCIGNPGQANYVSANAFLESLARLRKSSGLPATVVSWDAITDTGYLARNEQLASRLTKRFGLSGITSNQALDALERLLLTGQHEMIVMNANWTILRQLLPVLNSNLYRNIMHGIVSDGGLGVEDMAELLTRLPDNEKQPVIVNFLMREIARILQSPEEKIAHNSTIQDLGIDSLMAMELVSTIESKIGVDLPVMTLAENVTIDNIALRIISLLKNETSMTADLTQFITSLAKIHAEDMSADEIESITRVVDEEAHTPIRLIK